MSSQIWSGPRLSVDAGRQDMTMNTTRGGERPSGEILPVVRGGQLTVWLSGEIDLSCAPELATLISWLADLRLPLVVDVSDLTFCDATLAEFLSDAARITEVHVRRPTRLAREFVEVFGLTDRLSIDAS
jgi:hypothetical protein